MTESAMTHWVYLLVNWGMAVVVLSPSAIALVFLLIRKRRQTVLQQDQYETALLLYSIGAMISPGLAAAYVLYVSLSCTGGGCGSGVWMILTLPITYLLWLIGRSYAIRAFEKAPHDKQQ